MEAINYTFSKKVYQNKNQKRTFQKVRKNKTKIKKE